MTTIFTKIIQRQVPAQILFEDETFIVIKDIAPRAPFHALIIPKHPYENVVEANAQDPQLINGIIALAAQITEEFGGQFRLIFNTGKKAGQTVFHLHAHVLAGGQLEE